MAKRIIWLVAIASVAWLAATHLRKPAPVHDSTTDSVPAPTGPSGNGSAMASAIVSPPSSVGADVSEAPPSTGEMVARLTAAIREQLNSGDEAGRDLVLTNLLPRLVALDPAAAGRLAETIESEAGRQDVLRGVAQAWAGKDPAGALAWAARLPDTNEQRTTLSDIAFQIAHSDPAQAVDVAQQYHLGEGAGDVLPVLAMQWADKDLTAALAWAGNQPAGEQRDQIMARIAFVESQTSPAEAGARVLAQIPAGPVQEEAVMSVLHQWSLNDMAGASAWVELFPEGPLKKRALTELAVVGGQHTPSDTSSSSVSPDTP